MTKRQRKLHSASSCVFEHLTMVPFDLDGIDPQQMSDHERKLLNDYHRKVYETIIPYLNEDEKEWLKQATREI